MIIIILGGSQKGASHQPDGCICHGSTTRQRDFQLPGHDGSANGSSQQTHRREPEPLHGRWVKIPWKSHLAQSAALATGNHPPESHHLCPRSCLDERSIKGTESRLPPAPTSRGRRRHFFCPFLRLTLLWSGSNRPLHSPAVLCLPPSVPA